MKKRNIFVSCFLALIMSLSFVLPSIISSKNSIKMRTIDVNELGTLSYEEKAKQILEVFDEYEYTENEESFTFEANIDVTSQNTSSLEFLDEDSEKTTKNFVLDFVYENEKIYVITQYIQDGEIVHEEKIETTAYYDEYEDDYYIQMPDGAEISIRESIQNDNFEECSISLALLAAGLTAKEAAVLITAVVIVAAPVITTVVTKIVETFVVWVKSFWSWFKSLWTAKTQTRVTTVTTQTISYTISTTKTKYKLEKHDKNKKYEEKKYYAAIADTVDGFLYVSNVALSDEEALAILTTSTFVSGATKNKKGVFPQLVVSLYTTNGYDAYLIACAAGTILGNPGATHHIANKPGYYNHYHPGSVYLESSKPHVFYGQAL